MRGWSRGVTHLWPNRLQREFKAILGNFLRFYQRRAGSMYKVLGLISGAESKGKKKMANSQ